MVGNKAGLYGERHLVFQIREFFQLIRRGRLPYPVLVPAENNVVECACNDRIIGIVESGQLIRQLPVQPASVDTIGVTTEGVLDRPIASKHTAPNQNS